MKKVKLMALAITVILFTGMSHVNAQEKSTVLIKVQILGESSYIINTIKPDYTKYELRSKSRDEDSYVALKKELDKWILEGYVIANSTISEFHPQTNRMVYYLIKKE